MEVLCKDSPIADILAASASVECKDFSELTTPEILLEECEQRNKELFDNLSDDTHDFFWQQISDDVVARRMTVEQHATELKSRPVCRRFFTEQDIRT